MRNLRLLRAAGRRPAAIPPAAPQRFCLGAEPGVVLVGSPNGLVELGAAGQPVSAAGRGGVRLGRVENGGGRSSG